MTTKEHEVTITVEGTGTSIYDAVVDLEQRVREMREAVEAAKGDDIGSRKT